MKFCPFADKRSMTVQALWLFLGGVTAGFILAVSAIVLGLSLAQKVIRGQSVMPKMPWHREPKPPKEPTPDSYIRTKV